MKGEELISYILKCCVLIKEEEVRRGGGKRDIERWH